MFRSTLVRRAGLALGLITAAAYAVVALLGPNGMPALLKQRQELQALQLRNADLARVRDELKYRVDALDRDEQTQELEVRRKLGKAKQGEVIIKVDPPAKAN
jgi:cell division protein FtsB